MSKEEFNKNWWQGRVDGIEAEHLRWHQVVTQFDKLNTEREIVFLGYSTDTGVEKNNGRIGAADGPTSLRKAMCNFPAVEGISFSDAGNINPTGTVESEQQQFANEITKILERSNLSIGLGGGHDIAFAHYSGIKNYLSKFPNKTRLGIINFDAHYDIRSIENGAHSGNSFSLMAANEKKEGTDFKHLSIGIQKSGNTLHTFKTADELNIQTILAEDFTPDNINNNLKKISEFIAGVDYIYFTICMDSFSAAFAPGVSAAAYNGIIPDYTFSKLIKTISSSGKLIACDLAEVNPKYDIDMRTAKLGASFIFELISHYQPIQK